MAISTPSNFRFAVTRSQSELRPVILLAPNKIFAEQTPKLRTPSGNFPFWRLTDHNPSSTKSICVGFIGHNVQPYSGYDGSATETTGA